MSFGRPVSNQLIPTERITIEELARRNAQSRNYRATLDLWDQHNAASLVPNEEEDIMLRELEEQARRGEQAKTLLEQMRHRRAVMPISMQIPVSSRSVDYMGPDNSSSARIEEVSTGSPENQHYSQQPIPTPQNSEMENNGPHHYSLQPAYQQGAYSATPESSSLYGAVQEPIPRGRASSANQMHSNQQNNWQQRQNSARPLQHQIQQQRMQQIQQQQQQQIQQQQLRQQQYLYQQQQISQSTFQPRPSNISHTAPSNPTLNQPYNNRVTSDQALDNAGKNSVPLTQQFNLHGQAELVANASSRTPYEPPFHQHRANAIAASAVSSVADNNVVSSIPISKSSNVQVQQNAIRISEVLKSNRPPASAATTSTSNSTSISRPSGHQMTMANMSVDYSPRPPFQQPQPGSSAAISAVGANRPLPSASSIPIANTALRTNSTSSLHPQIGSGQSSTPYVPGMQSVGHNQRENETPRRSENYNASTSTQALSNGAVNGTVVNGVVPTSSFASPVTSGSQISVNEIARDPYGYMTRKPEFIRWWQNALSRSHLMRTNTYEEDPVTNIRLYKDFNSIIHIAIPNGGQPHSLRNPQLYGLTVNQQYSVQGISNRHTQTPITPPVASQHQPAVSTLQSGLPASISGIQQSSLKMPATKTSPAQADKKRLAKDILYALGRSSGLKRPREQEDESTSSLGRKFKRRAGEKDMLVRENAPNSANAQNGIINTDAHMPQQRVASVGNLSQSPSLPAASSIDDDPQPPSAIPTPSIAPAISSPPSAEHITFGVSSISQPPMTEPITPTTTIISKPPSPQHVASAISQSRPTQPTPYVVSQPTTEHVTSSNPLLRPATTTGSSHQTSILSSIASIPYSISTPPAPSNFDTPASFVWRPEAFKKPTTTTPSTSAAIIMQVQPRQSATKSVENGHTVPREQPPTSSEGRELLTTNDNFRHYSFATDTGADQISGSGATHDVEAGVLMSPSKYPASSPEPAPKRTPLFLPSPEASPVPEMALQSGNTTDGDFRTPSVKGKIKNRAYVLVPPLPEYLKRYKALQARQVVAGKKRFRGETGIPGSASRSDHGDLGYYFEPASDITNQHLTIAEAFSALLTRVFPDEARREIVRISCSRLRESRCRWTGCDTVMSSIERLIHHLRLHHIESEKEQFYTCRWRHCRKVCSKASLNFHVEKHVIIPLYCPYKGCKESFRSSRPLAKHIKSDHGSGTLMKSAAPSHPVLDPLPPIPTEPIPSYMVLTRSVQGASISPRRHAEISPQVQRNIAGPVYFSTARCNADQPLRRAKSIPVKERAANPSYEFLIPGASSQQYSSVMSSPARIRGKLKELRSGEITKLVKEGFVLFPKKDAMLDMREEEEEDESELGWHSPSREAGDEASSSRERVTEQGEKENAERELDWSHEAGEQTSSAGSNATEQVFLQESEPGWRSPSTESHEAGALASGSHPTEHAILDFDEEEEDPKDEERPLVDDSREDRMDSAVGSGREANGHMDDEATVEHMLVDS